MPIYTDHPTNQRTVLSLDRKWIY